MAEDNSIFKPRAAFPKQAIVMIFDLEGFSKFFSQPDVQEYVPKYLNLILEAINICNKGGEAYWVKAEDGVTNCLYEPLPMHIHFKFLGDGALYIWRYDDFSHEQIIKLINRFFNLKTLFSIIVDRASQIVPVIDIPKNIRFGIAAGSVFKLTYNDSKKEEYIGYSINLASRLQGYCRDIGFIFSGRLNIGSNELDNNQYIKKIAINIKGFPREYVILDKGDYDDLDQAIKLELFD